MSINNVDTHTWLGHYTCLDNKAGFFDECAACGIRKSQFYVSHLPNREVNQVGKVENIQSCHTMLLQKIHGS